jgi:hypothetical protein
VEALGITRLFPHLSCLDSGLRNYLLWSSLVLLCVFAGIAAGIAFLQDGLAAGGGGQSVEGMKTTVRSGPELIAAISHMALAFILPFVLSFASIPLAVFVRSGRTVLGFATAGILQAVVFTLRLSGNLVHSFGRFMEAMYDLMIAPFLWVERKITGERPQKIKTVAEKEMGSFIHDDCR